MAGLVTLVLALALAQDGEIDLRLQDGFFDPMHQVWAIPSADPLPRLLLYRLPKMALGSIGLGLLTIAWWPRARLSLGLGRRQCLLAFAVLALVPLLAGAGKRVTNVHCPGELRFYGGTEPYAPLWSSYDPADPPLRPGRCFPAAHASGGFGLLGLIFLARTARGRRRVVAVALGVGWLLGLYQQARGVHFFSHTLFAMGLALLVVGGFAIGALPSGAVQATEQEAQRP